MKHIIFGGDGFLGTELTKKLCARNENVLICDRKQTLSSGIYESEFVTYLKMNVINKETFQEIKVEEGDVV